VMEKRLVICCGDEEFAGWLLLLHIGGIDGWGICYILSQEGVSEDIPTLLGRSASYYKLDEIKKFAQQNPISCRAI